MRTLSTCEIALISQEAVLARVGHPFGGVGGESK